MLKKVVKKKRKATAEAGGSRKKPRARSSGPHPDDRQTNEGVTPSIAPPAALQTEPMTTPLAGPQIDLTVDMPPEEARATVNLPSAESAGPAIALAPEEDPPTGGGATAATEAATKGSPTSEGDEEILPTPGVEAAPLGSGEEGRDQVSSVPWVPDI